MDWRIRSHANSSEIIRTIWLRKYHCKQSNTQQGQQRPLFRTIQHLQQTCTPSTNFRIFTQIHITTQENTKKKITQIELKPVGRSQPVGLWVKSVSAVKIIEINANKSKRWNHATLIQCNKQLFKNIILWLMVCKDHYTVRHWMVFVYSINERWRAALIRCLQWDETTSK